MGGFLGWEWLRYLVGSNNSGYLAVQNGEEQKHKGIVSFEFEAADCRL
jgi:hypothetical protein